MSDSQLRRLAEGYYDFVDFGPSKGGSMGFSANHFSSKPLTGLGIDNDPKKVEIAREAGYDVLLGRVEDLPNYENVVRFVSALDFFEHLPSKEVAKECLAKAVWLAHEFIFIRHPLFENTEYLSQFGLRETWTLWRGHSCPLRLREFEQIFEELGITRYAITRRDPIVDSSHEYIVPDTAPIDTIRYDPSLGEKRKVIFKKDMFQRADIWINL
jgi:hypothetical protein